MFQKLQKKIKEFFEEKGQGAVEYALVLGFVAVIAVYLIGQSDIKGKVVDKGIGNATNAATELTKAYDSAKPTTT